MKKTLYQFAQNFTDSAKDLAPIVLVIAFFQIIVIQQPIPNIDNIIIGAGFVLIGLTLLKKAPSLGYWFFLLLLDLAPQLPSQI